MEQATVDLRSSSAPARAARALGVAMGALCIVLACEDTARAASPAAEPAHDPGAALVRAARESARRAADRSMRVDMTIVRSPGDELHRSLRGYEKWTPEGRKVLWVFESPADLAGTSFLTWRQPDGRELLWVYFPAQGRVRQVTDRMRRERFQGSDVTYEDLATIVYFDYEGRHSLLGEEPCGPATCAVIETELVPERFAYRRLRTWLRRDVPVPHRIEFFDEAQVKEVTVLETGTVRGIPTVLALEARHVGDDSRTVVRFSDVEHNAGLSEEMFSLASLGHGR